MSKKQPSTPTAQATVPTAQATVPTAQATVPTAQATVPSQLLKGVRRLQEQAVNKALKELYKGELEQLEMAVVRIASGHPDLFKQALKGLFED